MRVGVSENIGPRPTMEDASVMLPEWQQEEGHVRRYFGVYDGHGGTDVSHFAAENLHVQLANSEHLGKDWQQALQDAINTTDQKIAEKKLSAGSTIVMVAMDNTTLHIGNLGDTEALLVRKKPAEEQPADKLLLTKKHNPGTPEEKERIVAMGGQVFAGRLFGALAVSRSLGDLEFKEEDSGRFVSTEIFYNTQTLDQNDLVLHLADLRR